MTIAANITDEEAEAAFRTAVSALTPEMANANSTVATWLIKGYELASTQRALSPMRKRVPRRILLRCQWG
ncbi:maltose/maltodextrin ABC transporter substrate binding periplasmic protein MalE [Vibrio variabilis]|uniref:Maltose/maltodextrin ABC transporter substrate binding periplasmic protein MalE n=1 Tax=Vibrio variabilis TaxID=990271 RepID=A0ABQ0JG14_9VIBR|nr:maltose/maltodextrin ABC transporter substrate binding periplasmic protein MalE [Vibrio variabilis]